MAELGLPGQHRDYVGAPSLLPPTGCLQSAVFTGMGSCRNYWMNLACHWPCWWCGLWWCGSCCRVWASQP